MRRRGRGSSRTTACHPGYVSADDVGPRIVRRAGWQQSCGARLERSCQCKEAGAPLASRQICLAFVLLDEASADSDRRPRLPGFGRHVVSAKLVLRCSDGGSNTQVQLTGFLKCSLASTNQIETKHRREPAEAIQLRRGQKRDTVPEPPLPLPRVSGSLRTFFVKQT